MRISVQFDDAARTRGTLTIEPSWLERLFGRRRCDARIHYRDRDRGDPYLSSWVYDVDDMELELALEKIVNQRRRWKEEPSRFLTGARVVQRKIK